MNNNIIEDVSQLTTIPLASLNKISALEINCICHAVQESMLAQENITSVDIGIGKLLLCQETSGIRYKFIPSSELEKSLIETLTNRKSPLISQVEETLVSRIVKTYKDLL